MTILPPSPFSIADPPDDVAGAVWFDVDDARMFGVWRTPSEAGRCALIFLHDGLGSVGTLRHFPERTGTAIAASSAIPTAAPSRCCTARVTAGGCGRS